MTPPSLKISSSVALSILLLLSMASIHATAAALDPQQQEAPKYTQEEYKAFQDATGETDPAKKTELVVQFLRDRPESTLRDHVIASYQTMMNGLHEQQNWTQIMASGEKYLAVDSDDIYTMTMLTTAYQHNKNYKKFVESGEKVFASNPTGNLAYYMAKAYQDLKNDAKFLQWGEKCVELMPENHEILLELTKRYAEAKRNAQTAKYARMCVKAIQSTEMPEGVNAGDWQRYTAHANATCYAALGNSAYEQQDYGSAITNLENSLRYYKRNELAYYYLGMSYWQQARIDLAMKNFAKAYLLNGSSARAAKQYLENLYKSSNQNSLVGLERVIAKARQELN